MNLKAPPLAVALSALMFALVSAFLGARDVHAESSQRTVRIGVMNDQAGLYADISGRGSVWAARKAVADFGAAAKGIKVEILYADHQNKPDIGANIARQWYDTAGVDVIVDVPTSSVALAVNEITREKNKVLLVSGATTSDLTGKACSPNTIHWTVDTWALAHGTGEAVVRTGGDSWFFLTADYAFGHALERDTQAVVEQSGGSVLGRVRHPFPGTDFSSFLLQAQTSRAKIIGLANAGGDTINAIKQAAEFGIARGGQKIAALLMFITDVHALGLRVAQGLILTEAWYWNQNDASRAFARAYAAANNGMYPTMLHAGVYSAVTHYLRTVAAMPPERDGRKVVAKMKELATDDALFGRGSIRADGRKVHPLYLFEVKTPEESRGPWDYYKLRATIPAERAFRPMDGECPLLRH